MVARQRRWAYTGLVVFTWDADKAAANRKKHGIDFHEAATVLDDTLSTTFPDTDHSTLESRFLTIGMSNRQRLLVVAHSEDAKRFGSSAPDQSQATNEGSMKKVNRKSSNEMRPEYDFASMKRGVRGKYAKRYRAGTNLILLDPELAKAFPTDAAVNQALRAVLKMTETVRLASRA